MHNKFFERFLKKSLIFKDESKLDIDFVPSKLPHRNRKLSLLSQLFLALLTNPNRVSRKILIIGKKGVGKTRTLKVFGEMLANASSKRNKPIKYVHINCKMENTTQKVFIQIIRSFNNKFPDGEYSTKSLKETLRILIHEKPNMHLIIALDDLNYMVKNGEDVISSIFSLTNLYEISFDPIYSFSILGIVRDLASLNNLDSSTLSNFQRNIIKFTDYSSLYITFINTVMFIYFKSF